MNKREKKERLARIIEILKDLYPDATCALEYEGDPWRLLVMGRLSAQCTDARVNLVCKELFAKFPTPKALSAAPLCEIEEIVKPCGLYRMKAKNIQDASRRLLEVYDGVLPNTMEELLTFEGVGRKIANLLLGDIYHLPAVVTDTHCIRICGRWGMYPEREKRPYEVEKILVSLIDPGESSDFCHRVVLFGRDRCMARGPLCEGCPVGDAGLCAKRTREIQHD
jgi:endonuclease-3